MVVPGLLLGIVVVVLGWLLVRKRFAAQSHQLDAGTAPESASAPTARRETVSEELRDLRDALKPAEHSRIERRRPGGAGPYTGPERRRSAAKSLPPQRLHGLLDEGPPAPIRRK
jgi:hypothetical protein